jgi:mannonate dehydratase
LFTYQAGILMRLASVLYPLSDVNLTLASQLGVSDVVIRYSGPGLETLVEVKNKIEAFGMTASVVEGYLPIENIKLGNERRDEDIAELGQLIRNMGKAGIPILCYNFMAGTDWVRTSTTERERGGALVTGFDLEQVKTAMSLTETKEEVKQQAIAAEQMWDNLEYMLKRIVPVAEDAGVILTMHPDDPPLEELLGRARIMNSVAGFDRLLSLSGSPCNAICFCQGSFATMNVDIPEAIRRFGKRIRYVHFRDVRGNPKKFVETFHDNGPTDMVAAMRAYREIGFDGPLRPDHVPQLIGEEDGIPGYTMLGRLYAYGYIRGLMQATEEGGE